MRQTGSQEVQIIEMVKPITKYAVQVMESEEIRYHMERAYYEANSGRPGPVWLSIPLDVQAAMIDPETQKGFEPETENVSGLSEAVKETLELLKGADRPVILAGNGIKLAGATQDFYRLLDILPVPVLTTWKTIDMLGEEDELYAGHPGGMGDRGANLILQSADLLICVGSRLDTSLTAFNEPHFGMSAKKIIVDIDPNELNRMKLEQVEVKLACDAGEFIRELSRAAGENAELQERNGVWKIWNRQGHELRGKYPVVTEEHKNVQGVVSAYYFIDLLCKYTTAEDVIVPESSGAAGEITYQAFKPKRGQKMKNAAGLGSKIGRASCRERV